MSQAQTPPEADRRFNVLCRQCDRVLIVRESWCEREVQCPHCYSLMRVPDPPPGDRPVRADAPFLAPRKVFNFACPKCECVLEAHSGMSSHKGTCPTCGVRFMIPHLDRSGRADKAKLIEGGEDEAPAPVHAYAASGHQAPRIVEMADGSAAIQCPRCNAYNEIDADICAACGTPFTMVAAPTVGKLNRDRWASASVTFGVIGFLAFPLLVPAAIATWLGTRAVMFARADRLSITGVVGLALGLLGLLGGVAFWYWRLVL